MQMGPLNASAWNIINQNNDYITSNVHARSMGASNFAFFSHGTCIGHTSPALRLPAVLAFTSIEQDLYVASLNAFI